MLVYILEFLIIIIRLAPFDLSSCFWISSLCPWKRWWSALWCWESVRTFSKRISSELQLPHSPKEETEKWILLLNRKWLQLFSYQVQKSNQGAGKRLNPYQKRARDSIRHCLHLAGRWSSKLDWFRSLLSSFVYIRSDFAILFRVKCFC